MRRKRPNYWLPSENEANLKGLLDGAVTSIFTAVRSSVESADSKTIGSMCHGGPLFIYVSHTETTWVIQDDQFLYSVVVRHVEGCPTDRTFLDSLYEGDSYIPDYLRAQSVVDLSHEFGISETPLRGIRVHKLPDNYFTRLPDLAEAAGVHAPNECALEMMSNNRVILIGYRMDRSRQGIRFMDWRDVSPDFPSQDLSICLELNRN